MSYPSDTVQERTIARVLGPTWLKLPHHASWQRVDRKPYVDNLPDILAGLLRQFSTRMLDLGKLGIDDHERYQVYRGQVFDIRDALQGQLRDWLAFLTVTDVAGEIDPDLRELLLQQPEVRA